MAAMTTKDKVFMLAGEVHSTIRQAEGSFCCLQKREVSINLLASISLCNMQIVRHVTQETTPPCGGRGNVPGPALGRAHNLILPPHKRNK